MIVDMHTRIRVMVLSVFGLLLIWFLFWVSSFGFLEIVSPGSSEGASYTIYSQDGEEIASADTKSSRFKRLLRKGSYQVLVESGSKSHYSQVSTKRLFGTARVRADLKPEHNREFVGNNPGFCMHYGQAVLYSYNCSEPGELISHLPASDSLPTVVNREPGPPYIPLVGLVGVGGGTRAVAESRGEAEEVKLYNIDQSLLLSQPIELEKQHPDTIGGALPYKSGFVTHTDDLLSVDYFEPPGFARSALNTREPSPDIDNPVELTVYKDAVGALFNNSRHGDDEGLHEHTARHHLSGKSEFVVYGDSPRSYSFKTLYTAGGYCGTSRLCLISNGILDIYDINDSKARYQLSIKDVQRVLPIKDKIVIATTHKIFSIDQSALAGRVSYQYDDYQYCGLSPAGSAYIACVINGRGEKAALLIDPEQVNLDSVDKKIARLRADPAVSAVSVYKKYIYVSPNLGQPVYDPSAGEYIYDEALQKSTDKHINRLIKSLGIDTSYYKVVNSLQP